MPEPIPQEVLIRFDKACDDAAHVAIEAFHYLGLPEGDQISDLMARLNDAIANVMREWR